jgi:hypothetical protein
MRKGSVHYRLSLIGHVQVIARPRATLAAAATWTVRERACFDARTGSVAVHLDSPFESVSWDSSTSGRRKTMSVSPCAGAVNPGRTAQWLNRPARRRCLAA